MCLELEPPIMSQDHRHVIISTFFLNSLSLLAHEVFTRTLGIHHFPSNEEHTKYLSLLYALINHPPVLEMRYHLLTYQHHDSVESILGVGNCHQKNLRLPLRLLSRTMPLNCSKTFP